MPAIVPDMWVNLVSGRSMTSPTAKMSGLEVVRSSLTLTPPLEHSTLAASKPRPSMFGVRPVATSSASQTISTGAAPDTATVSRISGPPLEDSNRWDTEETEQLVKTWMPSSRKTSRINAAASLSSAPMISGATSNTVTSLPNLRKACAISREMGPAPSTMKRLGSAVRLNSVALVRKGVCSKPGIGGTFARPPVAMTALRKRRWRSPTRSSWGPTKVAFPM
mmetsp:Transcript_77458/g.171119  ORF Transcript_77458/g.171119 Transcript_77458/m.171119 type:complete len:222 (+) Transcript_77458:617-1282(+)